MKTICSRTRRGSALPIVLLVLPLAVGCGDQAKGTVSGQVTYKGKPLSSGFVTFAGEKGGPLHAEIHSDGSYRVDNVPVGPVKIGVEPKAAQDASSHMPRNPKDYGKIKAAVTQSGTGIPAAYSDPNQSGLTYSVTKGSQQHDIVLK